MPLWLSPVQVKIAPIADRHLEYAEKIAGILSEKNIRVETDRSSNTTEYKVREAVMQKIPFVLVVGDKEEQNNTVAVRKREENKVKYGVKTEDFIREIEKLVKEMK